MANYSDRKKNDTLGNLLITEMKKSASGYKIKHNIYTPTFSLGHLSKGAEREVICAV
jgi:hypothetical protein